MKGKAKKAAGKAPEKDDRAPKAEAREEVRDSVDEVGVLNDRLLRLQADFENFRKRTDREKAETYRRANESIMEELLPVLDSMGLPIDGALKHGAEPALMDGFGLVSEQLLAVLRKFGLEPVDAGQQFDPNMHEAVSHLPSDTVADGFIIAQTRRGYMLGDRLLRAAQVVVSSGPATDDGRPFSADAASEGRQTTDDGPGGEGFQPPAGEDGE